MASQTVADVQDDFDAEFQKIIDGAGSAPAKDEKKPDVNEGAAPEVDEDVGLSPEELKEEEEAKTKAAEEDKRKAEEAALKMTDAEKKVAEEKAAADKAAGDKAATDKAAADKVAADEEAARVAKMNDADKKKYEDEQAAKKLEAENAAREKAAREGREKQNAEVNKKAKEDAKAKAEADDKAAKEAQEKATKEAQERATVAQGLTAEQTASIDKFKEEWPDQWKAMEIILKRERAAIDAQYAAALQSVLEQVYSDLQPVAHTAEQTAVNEHFTAIRKVHPDYDELYPKLQPWIDIQPPYLAELFNKVYTSGKAEEVNDLVQRFKDANGIASPKPGTTPSNPTAPVVDPKKVATLAAVASGRTQPRQRTVDPNDYDSGFEEALQLEAANKKK